MEDMIAEIDETGWWTRRFLHGPGIDEPLAMVPSTSARGVNYFIPDHLGSISEVFGYLTSDIPFDPTHQYDSFGRALTTSGPTSGPYRYTGREYDFESGLLYYRARYYDPGAGRFVSEDPIGLALDINLYRYVRNGPVDLVDPTGLASPQDVEWLARALYGEFPRHYPKYPELVAWIVRNRMSTCRWGTSCQQVVTYPQQFSCFNKTDSNYKRVMNPNPSDPKWKYALDTAARVLDAPESDNPIPGILFYYSPRSMHPEGGMPPWAKGGYEIEYPGTNYYHLTLVWGIK